MHVVVKSVIEHIFFCSDESSPYALIDGTDVDSEGLFKLSANSLNMTYSNWRSGEPNNCCGGEHCATLYSRGGAAGRWNDIGCHVAYNSVCELTQSQCKSAVIRFIQLRLKQYMYMLTLHCHVIWVYFYVGFIISLAKLISAQCES